MFSHMRYIRNIPSTSEMAGLFTSELFFSSTDYLTRLNNWVRRGFKSESVPRRLLMFYPMQILIQTASLSANHVIRLFTGYYVEGCGRKLSLLSYNRFEFVKQYIYKYIIFEMTDRRDLSL